MTGLNFSGVEEAKERLMTRAGVIGVFKITDVKFANSEQKGTLYMGVIFSRKEDEFSHRFYLSEKALGRVKSLLKHACGVIMSDDNVQPERIISMLMNKEVALKVTARFDESNGRAYPDLSFGGFCKAPAQIGELEFNDKEAALNAKAKLAYESATTSSPEAPSGSSETSAPAIEEEVF